MARRKMQQLPYDKRGRRIVHRVEMLESVNYDTLTVHAKVLFQYMRMQWRNEKPVAYGIREAKKKLRCSTNTARNAFDQLQERGFIVLVEHSYFNSLTGSKPRTWRLTCMPFYAKFPTNDWEKHEIKINSTVSKSTR